MKTIIIYAGRYGCTEACANNLKSGLSGSVTLADIDKAHSGIDLEDYDTIILGSSVYIGRISKKMKALCKDNVDLLLNKKVGIFLCCAFPEQSKEYLKANFPARLLQCAVTVKTFGGAAPIDKMKYLDQFIMKAAMKGREPLTVSYENIDCFIREFNENQQFIQIHP